MSGYQGFRLSRNLVQVIPHFPFFANHTSCFWGTTVLLLWPNTIFFSMSTCPTLFFQILGDFIWYFTTVLESEQGFLFFLFCPQLLLHSNFCFCLTGLSPGLLSNLSCKNVFVKSSNVSSIQQKINSFIKSTSFFTKLFSLLQEYTSSIYILNKFSKVEFCWTADSARSASFLVKTPNKIHFDIN